MAQGTTPIHITGRLVADIDLRKTQSGIPVAGFRVCTQPRVFDKTTNQWGDGDPSFWPCNLWRAKAEAAAQQLHKGQLVMIEGTVAQRSWEDNEGNKRSQMEITVENIGPAILPPKQGGGGQQAGPSGTNAQGGYGQPAQDAWNQAPQSGFDGAQEPPF
ncbi:hypothetical protein CVAR_0835 [Corynebacterium variabile DSM 44702]|uniref:Single-stranded DNA-binding protein n=1 Tax=Corynebacterium variabile (strain DSM 44702 / CIP 107183 / JCM 12073 / NCIMB 30131) TaxID=858619 RepID=G0HB64_CORVD|nr:single-stranded DNA-binding protein [Corynebacterium variabile]AEK36189.1 hypothetical protein CVAR_0835 [Corynebacterium variabile DSM 44702]